MYAVDYYNDEMEDRHSLSLNFTAESAQLEKTLLRHTVTTEQLDNCPDTEIRNINWIANKDFTIEVGKKQIGEYIQTWELQPCWFYSVDFLCSTDEEHRTFHHYRARFSTPTLRMPIQGTASVYFVVETSKVKPQTLPVRVHFVVESTRLVHTPGRTRFREKWLTDIIDSKTLLRREVDI